MAEENNYIIEEEGEWHSMSDNMLLDIIGSFVNFADENEIPFEKFDYSCETDYRAYYSKKYPKFTEEVIDILVKCSIDKVKILDNGVNIEHKPVTVNFD